MVKITSKDKVLLLPLKGDYKFVKSDNIRAVSEPFEVTDEMLQAGIKAWQKEIMRTTNKPFTVIDGGKK